MRRWYEELAHGLKQDKKHSSESRTGMDYFLDEHTELFDVFSPQNLEEKERKKNAGRYRVASSEELKGFSRVAETNTLVRLCSHDLWELKEGEDGEFYIERLFDDNGNPLKV